jgi:LuxR family maltose regulon positive regulatory protein
MAAAAQGYRRLAEFHPHVPTTALARVDLAKLLYEWNDLAAAAEQARQGLEQSRRNADPEIELAAGVVLAYVLQRQGQTHAAQGQLASCAQVMRHPGLSPFAQLHAVGYRALTALAAGDLVRAAHCLEQAPPLDALPSVPEFLLVSLAQARLLLFQGQGARAARLLERRKEIAKQAGFRASLVETHAMLALCAGTEQDALSLLSQALHAGAQAGHVRAFLDLGPPMADYLGRAHARGIEAGYVRHLLSAFEGVEPAERHPARVLAPDPPATRSLLDPLSERESVVLGLLAQGQTYQEIGQSLYVSLNTVKTHVKHVYAKLQVHTRRQATAKAQELGLL